MTDDTKQQERLQRPPKSAAGSSHKEPEGLVDYCAAFGYLRGLREQSASVEFRFRRGASMWFPYSWLGPWRFDPSDGLLLKFSGALVYLVLIRGSNIDRPLHDGTINLTQCRFATPSGALGPRNELPTKSGSRRDRPDHRQHYGRSVRTQRRPRKMAR